MACACRGRKKEEFLWVPAEGSVDGEGTIVYDSEVKAKAKMLRNPGSTYYNRAEFQEMAMGKTVTSTSRITRVQ